MEVEGDGLGVPSRGMAMNTLRRMLVATDLSEASGAVFAVAEDLARPSGAQLIVAHVANLLDYDVIRRETHMALDDYLARLRAAARSAFEKAIDGGGTGAAGPVRGDHEGALTPQGAPRPGRPRAGRSDRVGYARPHGTGAGRAGEAWLKKCSGTPTFPCSWCLGLPPGCEGKTEAR